MFPLREIRLYVAFLLRVDKALVRRLGFCSKCTAYNMILPIPEQNKTFIHCSGASVIIAFCPRLRFSCVPMKKSTQFFALWHIYGSSTGFIDGSLTTDLPFSDTTCMMANVHIWVIDSIRNPYSATYSVSSSSVCSPM